MSVLSKIQFDYDQPETGGSAVTHRIQARLLGAKKPVGSMTWNSKDVGFIGTQSGFQRLGIATAMWEHGHSLAAENAKIPAPKHSADRTTQGDAWARSVGGRLPRRQRSYRSELPPD